MSNNKKYPEIELVKCDFCGSNDYLPILVSKDIMYNLIPGKYRIVKCKKCGLYYTNPRIKQEALKGYYSDLLYENIQEVVEEKSVKKEGNLIRARILTDYFNYPFFKKNLLRKLIQFPNYLRLRHRLKRVRSIPDYLKDGNVLEVGCLYGNNLFKLQNLGWKIKGIDLNKKAINFCLKHGLDAECCSFEDFKTNEKFDYIYMYNLLEHVLSPKEILEKAYLLLKKGGKLILRIPNFDGIEVRIYKRYAYTLQLPYHLFHFTPKSIKKYLKRAKFKKIKIVHDNFYRDLVAPIAQLRKNYPYKIRYQIIQRIFSQKIVRRFFIQYLVSIFSYLGITSRMIIICEK